MNGVCMRPLHCPETPQEPDGALEVPLTYELSTRLHRTDSVVEAVRRSTDSLVETGCFAKICIVRNALAIIAISCSLLL